MEPGTPVEKLKNIGAKSALALNAIGIRTAGELERMGVVQAYINLQDAGFNTTLNLLWSMAAGLVDMPWTELPDEVKDILRKQLADAGRSEDEQLPLL